MGLVLPHTPLVPLGITRRVPFVSTGVTKLGLLKGSGDLNFQKLYKLIYLSFIFYHICRYKKKERISMDNVHSFPYFLQCQTRHNLSKPRRPNVFACLKFCFKRIFQNQSKMKKIQKKPYITCFSLNFGYP